MTTIIVHGTGAKGASWYWSSWGEGGFCRAVADGMQDGGQTHDVWLVKGHPVRSVAALNPDVKWRMTTGTSGILQSVDGRYEWTGAPEGLARGAAAISLVQYLNALRSSTDEPIRIIAHSHGCNVVKLASSLPELDANVVIESAVFLACPHFWEDDYQFAQPKSVAERLNIRHQMTPEWVGRKFRYRVAPDRFGRLLNLYCSRDKVQLELAETWSGGHAPQTGGFLQNLKRMFGTLDVYEFPHGTRVDEDARVAALYENVEVSVDSACSGVAAHSVLHGAVVGRAIGRWLVGQSTFAGLGRLPVIACDDMGG